MPPQMITVKVGPEEAPFRIPRSILETSPNFVRRLSQYPGTDGWIDARNFPVAIFRILYHFLQTEQLSLLPNGQPERAEALVDVYAMAARLEFRTYLAKLQARILPALPTASHEQALFFRTMERVYRNGNGGLAFREFFVNAASHVLASDGGEPSPVVQQFLMKGGLMAVDMFRSNGPGAAQAMMGNVQVPRGGAHADAAHMQAEFWAQEAAFPTGFPYHSNFAAPDPANQIPNRGNPNVTLGSSNAANGRTFANEGIREGTHKNLRPEDYYPRHHTHAEQGRPGPNFNDFANAEYDGFDDAEYDDHPSTSRRDNLGYPRGYETSPYPKYSSHRGGRGH